MCFPRIFTVPASPPGARNVLPSAQHAPTVSEVSPIPTPFTLKGGPVPTAPVIPSSGSSLMQLVVMTLLFGGVGIALAAIPAFRGRLSQHATQIDRFVRPTRQQVSSTASAAAEPETAPSASRREIDEFDLGIFE